MGAPPLDKKIIQRLKQIDKHFNIKWDHQRNRWLITYHAEGHRPTILMAVRDEYGKSIPIDVRTFNKSQILLIVILLFCTAALYFSGLKNGFVNWDDHEMVLENVQVQAPFSIQSIMQIFNPVYAFNEYQPLTTLLYHVLFSSH